MRNNQSPKILISTSISMKAWETAKELNLSWKNALEFAIFFKLAEAGHGEFPENVLSERLRNAIKKLNEKSQELEKIKNDQTNDPLK